MTKHTKKSHSFEYYLEYIECRYCLYYCGEKIGCIRNPCCCEHEIWDAISHGRIKRTDAGVKS